jgi:hypothetical protein
MKMSTLHWALIASALTIGMAACTVTSDSGGDDAGTTGGSGGATGGSGGSAGSATGGSAGSATGGSAGSTADPCANPDTTNPCDVCVKATCCTELTACANDTATGCSDKMGCFAQCTDDPATCGTSCDPSADSTTFNDLLYCIYFNTDSANCAGDCY